ncbi:MAG: helix-turn-helix domain-containing protein, partial [Pseudobdellovibrionaceae bacterium]
MSETIETNIIGGNAMNNAMNNGMSNPMSNAMNSMTHNKSHPIHQAVATTPVLNGTAGTDMKAPDLNNSDNLFVANLQAVSLERLVKSKLEVLFDQQKEAQVELNGLYNIVLEQVEKPLLELSLKAFNGNQVKTAQMLGINRNTLKKKMDTYK